MMEYNIEASNKIAGVTQSLEDTVIRMDTQHYLDQMQYGIILESLEK
jgi:hypothetical protein